MILNWWSASDSSFSIFFFFKPPEIFSPSPLALSIQFYNNNETNNLWLSHTNKKLLFTKRFIQWWLRRRRRAGMDGYELRAWIDLDNNLYLSQSNFPIMPGWLDLLLNLYWCHMPANKVDISSSWVSFNRIQSKPIEMIRKISSNGDHKAFCALCSWRQLREE